MNNIRNNIIPRVLRIRIYACFEKGAGEGEGEGTKTQPNVGFGGIERGSFRVDITFSDFLAHIFDFPTWFVAFEIPSFEIFDESEID